MTLAEGDISELHVGLKGTMNALFLKDLAQKTRRGLEGRVRQGRSVAGSATDTTWSTATPARGASTMRKPKSFAVSSASLPPGTVPRAIAYELNKEDVPGPVGHEWRDTTIRGHLLRGTGILNNSLYVGQLVWNRLHLPSRSRTPAAVGRAATRKRSGSSSKFPTSGSSTTISGTRSRTAASESARAKASAVPAKRGSGNIGERSISSLD